MGFERLHRFHRVYKRQRQKTIKGKALSATNRHYIFSGLPQATLFINALDNIPFTGVTSALSCVMLNLGTSLHATRGDPFSAAFLGLRPGVYVSIFSYIFVK